MPLAWLCADLSLWSFVAVVIAITLIGIWAAAVADNHWGTHDSGRIVIDEVAGFFVTVALVDRTSWTVLMIGFVVFRTLDIVKPPPVRWLDRRLQSGAGVVLDDVAAGVMGCALLYGLAQTSVWATISAWP